MTVDVCYREASSRFCVKLYLGACEFLDLSYMLICNKISKRHSFDPVSECCAVAANLFDSSRLSIMSQGVV